MDDIKMHKELRGYIEGYNDGYRLAIHGKALKIPLKALGKGIISKSEYDEYTRGLRYGYEEGMRDLTRKMVQKREKDFEALFSKIKDRDGPELSR